MSIIPKSWTGVDELRDQVWQLQQKVELLEMLYARVQQPRPVSVDPAGKIGHSVVPDSERQPSFTYVFEGPVGGGGSGRNVPPSPERALNAAAVLAEAIAKHDAKAPDVSPALEFYNAAGGYAWFKRHATKSASVVHLYHRTDSRGKQWQATFGSTHKGRSKSKTFDSRREAEQFAFDVLTIHEAECIKRKAPTDWWNRVKIFEVIKR